MVFIPVSLLKRAFRRSRLRVDGLLAVEELGEASLGDVARALGADLRNVRGAFLGTRPYRVADSLVCLRLVRSREVAGIRLFSLTEYGRWVVGWLRSQGFRRHAQPREIGVL